MILIPLEEDGRTIAHRFRKAPKFAFLDEGQIFAQENHPHVTSKSAQFFDYFQTLGVDTIYLKALGYKTFQKLHTFNIKIYHVTEATRFNRISPDGLVPIDEHYAKAFCTLGHLKEDRS